MSVTDNRKIINMPVKVRFLRIHNNFTIGELAGVLKIHEDRISGLENGIVLAELEDVIRYCDHYCLDYEDFLFSTFPDFKAAYLKDEQKMMKTIGYKV